MLVTADPLAERPRALLMRALYAAGRQADALTAYHEGRELLADQLGVDPSAHLEQVYLGILRGGERLAAAASGPARPHDPSSDAERARSPAPAHIPAARAQSPRVLARRLAVFPGGATLAAAEQVCADTRLPGPGCCPRCPALSTSRSSPRPSAHAGRARATGCWRRCAPTAWSG